MLAPKPIVIITGANAGVGFGICQRLVLQLCDKIPKDALPQFKQLSASEPEPEGYDGLTIIMACRNKEKAMAARTKLFTMLDKHIEKLRRRQDYDGHAERFRKNLEVNFHKVDMADVKSVFDFSEEIQASYPYVSHLICNAGAGFFALVDVPGAILAFLKDGMVKQITVPTYKLQPVGLVGKNGLGTVWHSNLFGHYIMYRRLRPLFETYAKEYSRPARMLWTSSLEGRPRFYSHDDWQLLKTLHAYEGSKYEIDLVASELERRSLQPGGEGNIVRHLIVHPGVVWSEMSNEMIWRFMNFAIGLAFYFARLLGSTNHPITAVKGAVSASFGVLAGLAMIPTGLLAFSHVRSSGSSLWDDSVSSMWLYEEGKATSEQAKEAEQRGDFVPVKLGSSTDYLGREYVSVMPVLGWEDHKQEAEFLVEKCESLYTTFNTLHGPSGKALGDDAQWVG